jgi:hypothetical protein
MSSGLLLKTLHQIENEFSTYCTTKDIQCFANIIARTEARATNAYQDFSLD